MVAELAVLGAIGTVAGLIAWVTTTVEALNKKYHDFRDGASQLDYCRMRIRVIEQELKIWKNTWVDKYDNPYSDASYELFWGCGGFETIKSMLRGIDHENSKIITYLYCDSRSSPSLTDSERQVWREFLQVGPEKENIQPTDGWLKQLTYALLQGSYIKECIDRLKERVTMLESFSRREYWMLLSKKSDANKQIDPMELSGTIEFQTQFTSAVRRMWQIYNENEESKKWWLILGKPSPEETLRGLAEGSEFTLNFVHQRRSEYLIMTMTINPTQSISKEPVNKAKTIELNSIVSNLSIKEVLHEIGGKPSLRKAREPTLGIVAISLVKTMVLLYSAPWTRDLCTCGILLPDTKGSAEDMCTFRQNQNPCHDENSSKQAFLRLAVALAELALRRQIMHVRFNNGQYIFDVCKTVTHGVNQWTTVDEERLLNMVRNATGSRHYKLALQSCLTLARLESRNDVIVRPELIRRSPEDIVKP
jgi:hypothetical protein